MINTETRLRRLERIVEISRELTSTVALGPLLHKIVKMAAELSGSQSASMSRSWWNCTAVVYGPRAFLVGAAASSSCCP